MPSEINYWQSEKIPTVQYGAKDFCFSLKSTATVGEESAEYARIKEIVDKQVEDAANGFRASLNKDLTRFRIREKDGKKYPSVTSIINPEPYTNDPAYGVRGTEYHRLFNEWLLTGVVNEPNSALDIGKLKWDIKFEEFIRVWGAVCPRKDYQVNVEIFNEELMYSGEIDYIHSNSLDDIKTGGYKLEQLCAYNESLKEPKNIVRFLDLKNAKLVVYERDSKEYKKSWNNFIFLRGVFKGKYGI